MKTKINNAVYVGTLLFLFSTIFLMYRGVTYGNGKMLIKSTNCVWDMPPIIEIIIRFLFISLSTYFLSNLTEKNHKTKLLLPLVPCAFIIGCYTEFYLTSLSPESPVFFPLFQFIVISMAFTLLVYVIIFCYKKSHPILYKSRKYLN